VEQKLMQQAIAKYGKNIKKYHYHEENKLINGKRWHRSTLMINNQLGSTHGIVHIYDDDYSKANA